jgi:hypothetical protein
VVSSHDGFAAATGDVDGLRRIHPNVRIPLVVVWRTARESPVLRSFLLSSTSIEKRSDAWPPAVSTGVARRVREEDPFVLEFRC